MKSIIYLKRTWLVCLAFSLFVSYANAQAQTMVWSMEAELFDESLPANPSQASNYPRAIYQEENCYTSGCGFAENISANSAILFRNINIPEEGTYELWMYYMMNDPNGRGIGVTPIYQHRDTIWVMEGTGSFNGSPQYDTTDPDNPVAIPGTGGSKIAKKLIYLEKAVDPFGHAGSHLHGRPLTACRTSKQYSNKGC